MPKLMNVRRPKDFPVLIPRSLLVDNQRVDEHKNVYHSCPLTEVVIMPIQREPR